MGLFGKSKDDTSQDQQLKNLWAWIDALNKRLTAAEQNTAILVKNNVYFISRDKALAQNINALIQKDAVHDKKDSEHDALITSIKSMARSIETTGKAEGEG